MAVVMDTVTSMQLVSSNKEIHTSHWDGFHSKLKLENLQ